MPLNLLLGEMNTSTEDNLKLPSSQNCHKSWIEPNDPLFSLFQIIILLAFSVPANFNITRYLVKFLLVSGYIIALIWINYRTIKGQASESLANWYYLFLTINGFQLIFMLTERHINQIPRDLVNLYSSVFQPLAVKPRDFLDLTKLGTIKDLPANRSYAIEGSTKIGLRISILLSGRLNVTFGKTFLHDIESNEFIDSIEFKHYAFYCTKRASSSCNLNYLQINAGYGYKETSFILPEGNGRYILPQEPDIHQVTIKAVESSKIITWEMITFVDFLENRDKLRCVIDSLIGKDIIHKLYGRA